jgi:hypothetical protein
MWSREPSAQFACGALMSFGHLIVETELQPKRTTKHRFRARIFAQWAYACAYCGDGADTLDHVRPRFQGGLTVAENLVPACQALQWGEGLRRLARVVCGTGLALP